MKMAVRKLILIIMSLATLSIVTGCGKIDTNTDNAEELIASVECKAKVISIDYNDEFVKENKNQKVIISNYNELKTYCRNLNSNMIYIDDGQFIGTTAYIPEELSVYNDEFFKDKSLALIYVELSCINYDVDLESAKKVGNDVIVEYNINCDSEVGLTAMGAQLIVVEVDKDINGIQVI